MLYAGEREAGVMCPHCQSDIARGAEVAQCTRCGTVHHRACWEQRSGCGSYDCAPGRREAIGIVSEPIVDAVHIPPPMPAAASGPAWTITADELSNAVPLPPPRDPFSPEFKPKYTFSSSPDDGPKKVNKIAVTALVCGVLGVVLSAFFRSSVTFAAPVFAVFCIILACVTLSGMHNGRTRGLWMAVSALILGFGDIVIWGIVISATHNSAPMIVRTPQNDLDPAALKSVEPAIADAMRANVVVLAHSAMSERMGSGVILKIEQGVATLVTNRHVVDGTYEGSRGESDSTPDTGAITVRMLGQGSMDAKLVWVAPGGVDLVILKVPCTSSEVRAAKYPPKNPPRLGDGAFAVGNPHSLGWTFSPGSISQFRKWPSAGPEDLVVIQTSAPINSGNSGGGLYDKDGALIGINTWTEDKQTSEGLGFAISADYLLKNAPAEHLQKSPPLDPQKSPTTSPAEQPKP
jgi:S1-C subfamily serine protease